MRKLMPALLAAAAAAMASFVAGSALAQYKGGGSKIICWQDKSGKVIGCGDHVPPEYQEGEFKELDRRGITRRTSESAEVTAKRKAETEARAKQEAEEKKRLTDQRRQDTALLNSFSSANEIDLKRDRDLQVADTRLGQLRLSLRNTTERHNDFTARVAAAEKSNKPVSDFVKDEVARTASEMQRIEQSIATAEKEKDDTARRYAEMKLRYNSLKGGASTAAAPPKKQ
jgi:chromosome segregation ATPase